MADWKNALAALGGTPEPENMNTDFACVTDAPEEVEEIVTLPKSQQKLRLNMERAGRGGKTVTLIKGFIGTDEDLNSLCKMLKQKCGVGGAVKEGEVIIQGDHRQRLIELLQKEGYSNTK